MSIIFINGFEAETNYAFRWYLQGSGSAYGAGVDPSIKRSGSNSLIICNHTNINSSYLSYYTYGRVTTQYTVANSTVYIGFGIRLVCNNPNWDYYMNPSVGFITIGGQTSGDCQIKISLTANGGRLQAYSTKTGTIIGSSSTPNTIYTNTQYYIQMKMYSHNSNGTFTLKLNNNTEIDLTGLNTQCSSYKPNMIQFTSQLDRQAGGTSYPPFHIYIDDVYVADDAGSTNNNFLGSCSIISNLPIADGDATGMIASSGNKQDCVNEAGSTSTDTVYTDTTNEKVLFNFSDNTINANILCLQTITCVARSEVGSGLSKYRHIYRDIYDNEYESQDTLIISSGYSYVCKVLEANPISEVQQSNDDILNMQFGQKTIRIE